MKKYIGAKIILGEPMDELTFETTIKNKAWAEGRKNRPGYLVVYPPDDYQSWSPTPVFENAYREVTPGEIELIERASVV